MKTIALEGTWASRHEVSWADPSSPWMLNAMDEGVDFFDDIFEWSTELDGVIGRNSGWIAAAKDLKWHSHKYEPNEYVNLVAHSHGGNVAAYACADGMYVKNLITVGTPVRWDMRKVWKKAYQNIGSHTHLYGSKDYIWIFFGSFFDGTFGLHRRFPKPTINYEIGGESHSSLFRPELWTENKWWDLLK